MKIFRWLITISILVTVPILIDFRTLAYTAPNGQEYEYKYSVYNSIYSSDFYTNREYCLCTVASGQNGGYRFYSLNNSKTALVEFDFNTANSSTLYGSGSVYGMNNDGSIYDGYLATAINGNWTAYSKNVSGYSELQTFSSYQSAYEYLTTPRVDWDNPYYSPTMVIPEFEVNYNLIDSGETTPFMPCSVYLTNANSNLYCEVVCVNYMPSVVNVEWQNYSAKRSHKFEQHNLIGHDELKLSTDVGSDYIGNALQVAWLQDVTSYPVSEVSFVNGIGTDSGSLRGYNNMVDMYPQLRRIGLFYGNNTEIYVRYFMIGDNNEFIVSAWRTWTSQYSESFGVEIPSYYKTYNPASGYQNIDPDTSIIISPTSAPDVINPSNQVGVKTGSPITINIGQNVPNYPDYPTIATYNLDNMLVSTLNNAKDIGTFFSGVTGFFGATLAFIPPIVWQVVAFGFACSIVIMFLKIL